MRMQVKVIENQGKKGETEFAMFYKKGYKWFSYIELSHTLYIGHSNCKKMLSEHLLIHNYQTLLIMTELWLTNTMYTTGKEFEESYLFYYIDYSN